MKMIDLFTGMYSVSKTLKFSLIPVGNTEENFNAKNLLEEDEERANNYAKVKKIMDRYHRQFIENVLSDFRFSEGDMVRKYAELYYDKDFSELKKLKAEMRKQIGSAFKSNELYSDIMGAKLITEILPEFVDEEERKIVEQFNGFATYFTKFWDNRENIYKGEEKSTSIAYRCIDDNLPKFINNIKVFNDEVKVKLGEQIKELESELIGIYSLSVGDLFTYDAYELVMSQSGIDRYNSFIGGYTCSDGTKIKGINEHINLYNQEIVKVDKRKRIPLLIPLYKQILSDRETISFIPEKFEDDKSLLEAVYDFYNKSTDALKEIKSLFECLSEFDHNGIYIKSGRPLTDISNEVFENWSVISDSWREEYREIHPQKKKSTEKYEEEIKKAYKNISNMSIAEIDRYGKSEKTVDYFKAKIAEIVDDIDNKYIAAKELLESPYPDDKKLALDEKSVELIKELLDAFKELEYKLKMFDGDESDSDILFYSQYSPLFDHICTIDKLYDKVRNYVTQKPYSKDKIKLNFDNPQLLGGWDKNKETDYRCVILRKNGNYYLAIMDKDNKRVFDDEHIANKKNGECYQKMEYKFIPDPQKMLPKVFFAEKNLNYFAPDKEIMRIKENKTYNTGDVSDCRKYIDFFKNSIFIHPEWKNFGFKFSDTNEYNDMSQFYKEVANQAYSVSFTDVSKAYIDSLTDEGKIYLFQIYNKDFSPYSHGTPNMHTLYFRMLFESENLADVVFKLNGRAEMFYRKASLPVTKPTHPANVPIKNKNPYNSKKESVFSYDLIKDRRFTQRQYSLNLSVTVNFKDKGISKIKPFARNAIRESNSNYVIGIDRGERNLLYICVIDYKSNIVYQRSLNDIVYGTNYKVDYHRLLDEKEKARDKERKNWKSIENIKELKEGYLSAVINEICKLIVKYDAVVALEDLNDGFKRGRFKVEKQVYQKFENMLINKLNYLVDKQLPADVNGGLLHGYQLTDKVDGQRKFKDSQNGFIFYVPAYLTSKIDPVTGFVDLIHPKYSNVKSSKEFFERFDDVYYSENDDMFAFELNYDNFERCSLSYRKEWVIWTNGERIRNFRNSEKNNEWDYKLVFLTDEFKNLFEKHGIDYKKDLKAQILHQESKTFFEDLTRLFNLTLQMRNSCTGEIEIDYIVSPVKNSNGKFYDSRDYSGTDAVLPVDADANGAYNIARKGLWALKQIKEADEDEYETVRISMKNNEWLKYAQES